MKIRIIISICFLITSCSLGELTENERMKSSIDKLEFSKKIIEVEIDSIGNIVDTISIEQLKFDSRGKKRFRKRAYWYKDRKLSWIDYFKPDEDLFFRKVIDEEGNIQSIFETLSNQEGEIKKAIQIDKETNPNDTILMEYSHDYYQNGHVKNLSIRTFHEEFGASISKINYDEQENPVFEVVMMEDDTISFQNWEYSDKMLRKSIYTNYQMDTSKSVYYFGEKKLLVSEEEFEYEEGFFTKSKKINHSYDESDDRIKTIERNLKSNDVKYIKYIIEK